MAVTKLYTIGYERVGQIDFVAALKAAKIKTLVDVREVANSRRAGVSKKSLAAALDEAGIAYIHMKLLGSPKLGRDAARRGDTKTMTRIYEAKLVEPEAQLGLAETADLAKRGRMVVMAGREARPVFPVGPFYVKDCSLHGFAMFNASPDEQRECAADINRWLAEGKLKPRVARIMPLAQAAAAHRLQEENTLHKAGTLAGKIVLKP